MAKAGQIGGCLSFEYVECMHSHKAGLIATDLTCQTDRNVAELSPELAWEWLLKQPSWCERHYLDYIYICLSYYNNLPV